MVDIKTPWAEKDDKKGVLELHVEKKKENI